MLADSYVSRQHFKVERRGDEHWIVDLGSRNCSAVNGIPAKQKKLENGDEIHLGSTRIVYTGATPNSLLQQSAADVTRVIARRELEQSSRFEMIGSSAAMQSVFSALEKVAPVDATVLVHGESGTGKELIARALHQNSKRAKGPLVTLNCASIPKDLAESELFGHEKGAFTGANSQRLGKFELANGGTLFLDEIGELPLESQAKMLRVLEERKITRVGGERDFSVNVRVVAATHQNLSAMVQQGRFRQDLHFRLEVVTIVMPPLRERGDDIAVLARHFLNLYREKIGRRVDDFTPEALDVFAGYAWPGNVRELKNVIERAVIMGSTPLIAPCDLLIAALPKATVGTKAVIDTSGPFPPLDEVLQAVAIPHIKRALEMAEGNKKKAADLLGVPRTSMYDLFKRYGIK